MTPKEAPKCPACRHDLAKHKKVDGTALVCGCTAPGCKCDYVTNMDRGRE